MMNNSPKRDNQWMIWLVLGSVATALLGVLGYLFLRRRRRPPPPASALEVIPDLREFQGLSEAEAQERLKIDPDELRKEQLTRSRKAIIRRNARSRLNFTLLGLAVIQWFLEDQLGALLTIGIILLNILINVAQQMISIRRVQNLAKQSRPQATVIREGRVRSVDPATVVEGDLVAIGPGDEVLADGQIVSESSLEIDDSASQLERGSRRQEGSGGKLHMGGFCVSGRSVYEVSHSPAETIKEQFTTDLGLHQAELTPLQIIIGRILQIMTVAVILFLIPFIFHLLAIDVFTDEILIAHRDIASIIFSIAPSGLFFMIVVTYATGSADIARLGALVRDSMAVETLAELNVLCFDKADTLTGLDVKLQGFQPDSEDSVLSEARIRQVLGDYVASSAGDNRLFTDLKRSFEGQARDIDEENPYFSIYGWSGVTFSDADIKGTYVIGVPDIIQENLLQVPSSSDDEEDSQEEESRVRRVFGRITGIFSRKSDNQPQEEPQLEVENEDEGETEAGEEPLNQSSEEKKTGLFSRIRGFFPGGKKSGEGETENGDLHQDAESSTIQLAFAYSPDPQPLIDEAGHPILPIELVPLCTLEISEEVRPEAKGIISEFLDVGVRVNILSSDTREHVLAAAKELGMIQDPTAPSSVITGAEIDSLEDEELIALSESVNLYSQLTSDHKARVVRSLQASDQLVGIVAGQLSTVEAMYEADIRITKLGGSQEAFNLAEIVLMEDSLEALSAVLLKGQKIVNGLLDILRLNLTQITYVAIMLLVMLFSRGKGFAINSTQSGIIAFFTVILPSIGLTFWAQGGAVPRHTLAERLAHFVLPAAATIALFIISLSFYYSQENTLIDTQYFNTYALMVLGLLLVVFAQPPGHFWAGGDAFSGDLRPTILAIVSFVLYNLVILVPLAQELLKVQHLRGIQDYLLIAAAATIWVFLLRGIWRFRLVQLGTRRLSNMLGGDTED
ncbi:MAG: HAD family hydrolase [Anaerolineales bacterium]|nr:MAG: HAD family hydrolase [Anaerolineales bacterium]